MVQLEAEVAGQVETLLVVVVGLGEKYRLVAEEVQPVLVVLLGLDDL